MAGCIWAYQSFPTGLMPEIFKMIPCPSQDGCQWDPEKWATEGGKRLPEGFRSVRDPKYILRPEAIESVFILYRITGDESLRDVAWEMFKSITASTETALAYSAISDVTVQGETRKTDSMEVSLQIHALGSASPLSDARLLVLFQHTDSDMFTETEFLDGRDTKIFLPDLFAA